MINPIHSVEVLLALLFLLVLQLHTIQASSKDKPHPHEGKLSPYDGAHIEYDITPEQNEKLKAGQPVTFNERTGKAGRGVALQDVNAPPEVCMNRIMDIANYPKMVPKVRSVDIYDVLNHTNGTAKQFAEFEISIFPLSFKYYLDLTYKPEYHTYTWTLDHKHTSDLDDSTGHWQVMPHPTKAGWSRVLYSTQVLVMPWIPEFVLTFLTKSALLESTAWVKKESEQLAGSAAAASLRKVAFADLTACFSEGADGSAHYSTTCANSGTTIGTDSGEVEEAQEKEVVDEVDAPTVGQEL